MVYMYDVTNKKDNKLIFSMILYDKKMKDKWYKEIMKKSRIVNVMPRKLDMSNEKRV